MSGGFFRGTSADQDTRFSNKQAKLLKSQKFAPELEHLVDTTKVSMDVIRPWIANRVTELLGFEDEVLINFIYGLLDGKEVNGKQVQISLTGFMEKNTGKFMKELWTLLLSAQKNASGVPQQFLDAKQEETRKKKEEADRIANEIQRKKDKESRELEEERLTKMDGGAETKASNAASEGNSKHTLPRASLDCLEDEQEIDKRNGVRTRDSRGSPSRSNTRSYSDERRGWSRSMSRSPNAQGRSITSNSPRRPVSPPRRNSPLGSVSPVTGRAPMRTRSPSPPRRRSPYRRRSPSPVRRHRLPSPARSRRSPSPARRRRSPSPVRRRRLPSPVHRRRSPSPLRRRRSPAPLRRRRSPSPVCHHRSPSPVRRRSPSPVRHRRSTSPSHRRMSRSPVRRRRSPLPVRRRRSPSPVRRSTSPSPSPVQQRRSPSPVRRRMSSSPMQRRLPTPARRRSPSPVRRRSQRSSSIPQREYASPARQRSPVAGGRRSTPGSRSPRLEQSSSLVRRGSPSPIRMKSLKHQKGSPVQSPCERMRSSSSLRLLRRESRSQNDSHNRIVSPSPSPERAPARSRSLSGERSDSEERSPRENASRQPRGQMTRDVSFSPPRKPREQQVHRKSMEISVERKEKRGIPYIPDRQRSPTAYRVSPPDGRRRSLFSDEGRKSEEKNLSRSNNVKESIQDSRLDSTYPSVEKIGNDRSGIDSDSEEDDKPKTVDKEKSKHKRSERREAASDDDYSSDSEKEERREAKRRRKEEKRLRKEKKRQKREDRRRRREERRSEKLRGKNQGDASGSDAEYGKRRKTCNSGKDEMETEQKKLEIELRNKALESLKAKKAVSH